MTMFRAGFHLPMQLMCGCATVELEPGRTQTIKRVAVISAIGDKFTMRKIGFTVFNNEERELPIDSWRIDDFVIGKVRSVLAGRYDVRPVAYDKAAFNTQNGSKGIADAVRALSPSPDIDAYIVVTKASAPYRMTNQSVYGLGVVERTSLGDSAFHLHVLYWITVVDGHDYSVIGSAVAVPPGQITEIVGGLSRQIDKSWLPDSTDPAQNPRLKGAVTELLDRNLPGTIERLKLLQ
jgi:hypothetical protein